MGSPFERKAPVPHPGSATRHHSPPCASAYATPHWSSGSTRPRARPRCPVGRRAACEQQSRHDDEVCDGNRCFRVHSFISIFPCLDAFQHPLATSSLVHMALAQKRIQIRLVCRPIFMIAEERTSSAASSRHHPFTFAQQTHCSEPRASWTPAHLLQPRFRHSVGHRDSIAEGIGPVISVNDRPGIARRPLFGAALSTSIVRCLM